jgi:hypothetical protein
MAKNRKFKEGELFHVPIAGKYILALVTRVNNGIPLGFFYDTLYDQIPLLSDILAVNFQKPILIAKFGSQGFKDGTWGLIGILPNYKRSDFPMPVFFHHTLPFKPVLVFFDDDMNELRREAIEESKVANYKNYPTIGLGGSLYIEKKLTKILDPAGP